MTQAQEIIRAVNRAEEVHLILSGMARVRRARTSMGVDVSAAPGAPLDLAMVDLADDIRNSIQGWARLTEEEQGDLIADGATPALALHMRQRAIWIAGAEWAPVMVEELTDLNRRAIGALGLLPQRTPMPERCHCGAVQWVYHERPPFVRCRDGHASRLIEHLHGRGVEAITQVQAAWVLDCTQSAVSKRASRGELTRSTAGGITVESVRAAVAATPLEC